MSHTYTLTTSNESETIECMLELDEREFKIFRPDGELIVLFPTTVAHNLVDLPRLYYTNQIVFYVEPEPLVFDAEEPALNEVKRVLEALLRWDTGTRGKLKQYYLKNTLSSIAKLLIGMSLFIGYCWLASWMPDPPDGHWFYWVAPIIYLGLMGILIQSITWFQKALVNYRSLKLFRTHLKKDTSELP